MQIGDLVLIFGLRYHHAGKVVGYNNGVVTLNPCWIIFETGPMADAIRGDFQTAEYVGEKHIKWDTIDSWGPCPGIADKEIPTDV